MAGEVLLLNPKVSIIVPAHNEEETIELTINSLVDLDYTNKEIIIVDDNSKDNTYGKVKPYASRGLVKLFRKTEPRSNKARAVNFGAQFATGDLIVIIDADTIINRDSIVKIIDLFSRENVVGAAGNVRVYNNDFLLGRIQDYEYLMAMELGRAFQSIMQILLIIPGAFGAFRVSVFRRLGEMDEDTITEDFDLALKLRKTGGRILFNNEAIAWTVVPSSWKTWFRQRVRWARGQVQTLRKHKDMLFSWRYGFKAWISMVDMFFMDILLLFLRLIWIISLPLIYPNISLWELFTVMALFYLFMESISALVALILSPRRREDLTSLSLLPLIVFFYRPFYAVVRLYAYIQEALGFEAKW